MHTDIDMYNERNNSYFIALTKATNPRCVWNIKMNVNSKFYQARRKGRWGGLGGRDTLSRRLTRDFIRFVRI